MSRENFIATWKHHRWHAKPKDLQQSALSLMSYQHWEIECLVSRIPTESPLRQVVREGIRWARKATAQEVESAIMEAQA